MEPKIHFLPENGEPIPFSDWLKAEKERLNISWRALDELTGVNRTFSYVSNGKSKINNPSAKKFKKIVTALGHNVDAFQAENLRGGFTEKDIGMKQYTEHIKTLGDALLELHAQQSADGKPLQKVSTTFIRQIAGEPFYVQFGKQLEKREQVLDAIHALGPEYQHIELQHQVQQRTYVGSLDETEKNILTDVLLSYVTEHDSVGQDWLPRGVFDEVLAHINTYRTKKKLPKRSRSSIIHHVHKEWTGTYEKNITFARGSPDTHSCIEKLIVSTVEDLAVETTGTRAELEDIIDIEDNATEMKQYLSFNSFGHQALIAFLMDPENYIPLLGQDTRLLYVDFSTEDVADTLLEEHVAKAKKVNSLSEDREIIGFVDRWLRCDMIYKTAQGEYVVVEVKQNAIDTEQFPNAEKAMQQLDAYTGVVLGNIRRKNMKETAHRPEQVTGMLAAYVVEQFAEQYLEKTPDRGALVIDKKNVYAYLGLLKNQEQASEQKTDTVLDMQPNVDNVHSKKDPEHEKRKQAYLDRQKAFAELSEKMNEIPEASATWAQPPVTIMKHPDENITYLVLGEEQGEKVYLLNGCRCHTKALESWEKEGKLASVPFSKYATLDTAVAV